LKENKLEEPGQTLRDEKIDSRWRDPEIALLIGLVYFLSMIILPPLMQAMGVPQFPTAEYLADRGTVHALSIAFTGFPALAFLLLYLRFADAEFLKLQLSGENHRVLGAVFLGSLILFVFLDNVGVLPFTWRTMENGSLQYARILVDTRAVLGVVILGVSGVLITPVIEEAVFRFGVIQWTLRRTHAWSVSVGLSAVLFGLAHTTPFSQHNSRLAAETFAFGLFTGWCVFKRQGRIGIPIALHAAKNAAEFVGLIAAANLRP